MSDLDVGAIVWSKGDPDRPLVLLLHGFGSNERDLAGLTPALPSEYRYAALRGPLALPVPLAPGFEPGYAWFSILANGAAMVTSGARGAARVLADWAERSELAPVGAIGFSQGGALALELLREAQLPLQWAAALAGWVLDTEDAANAADTADAARGDDPRDHTLAQRRPPVFWGRGVADTVIPSELVERTRSWLPAHTEPTIRAYPSLAHAVSADELTELSN